MGVKIVNKQKLDTNILKKIIEELPEATMRVGWKKTQKEENGMKTWEVAYLNEVGHCIHHKNGKVTHIVPRPFLQYTCETHILSWKQAWRELVRGYIADKYKTFRSIMRKFCKGYIIEDIRRVIVEEKPFAPNYRTNKKTGEKDFLKKTPLIDYGTMVATMTYEIELKDK